MNIESLPKAIATSGHKVGFGGLSTLDIVEKMLGWIGFLSLISDFLPWFITKSKKYDTAAFTIVRIAVLTEPFNPDLITYTHSVRKSNPRRSAFSRINLCTIMDGSGPGKAQGWALIGVSINKSAGLRR